MMRFEAQDVEKEFLEVFNLTPETVTPEQIKFLIKFSKHVRGRCRSNVVLHNYLRQSFKMITFKEEQRTNAKTNKDYTVLNITNKISLQTTNEENSDE